MTQQEINLYIIIGVILLIFAVSGFLIEYFDNCELKVEQRKYRHRNDEDKQRITDEIESIYYKLIIQEILK